MPNYTETDLRFIDGMRAAVADRGSDWVYPTYDGTNEEWFQSDHETCVYSLPSGEPACLIGKALSKVGMPVPHHKDDAPASEVLERLGIHANILEAADMAQWKQDRRMTWGIALEVFEWESQ